MSTDLNPAPDLGWLDELERLRAAATPGPWTADGQVILQPEGYSEWPVVACDYGVVEATDAALIVAAVNALPRLAAAVRAVEALADDLDSYVAARGCPATGSYDDGLNRAQAAAAADLRSALTAALASERTTP